MTLIGDPRLLQIVLPSVSDRSRIRDASPPNVLIMYFNNMIDCVNNNVYTEHGSVMLCRGENTAGTNSQQRGLKTI